MVHQQGQRFRPGFLGLVFFLLTCNLAAQDSAKIFVEPQTVHKAAREKLVVAAHGLASGAGLYLLYESWYRGHAFGRFKFVNDNKKWLQVDKAGHAWSGYIQGRMSVAAWRWCGLPESKALWTGVLTGFTFQHLVEMLDGFSLAWGFSWGDYLADIAGSALLLGQALAWKEQRISYKFSTHKKTYSETILQDRANEIYGAEWTGRLLNDYNAQTYWLSFNLRSFIKTKGLPAWLNLAFGYGAEGMFGEKNNSWTAADGTTFHRTDQKRLRQFYLAPDVDLTRIRTGSRFLKTFLFIMNAVKLPAPAIEFSNGETKFHWLAF